MYKDQKVLAIIPARGGSKGLPKKNIKPLLGKPLIGWTIEQALASRHIDTILVSTDSEEIAEVAGRHSDRDLVPFLRPPELAQDNSPTADAVIHGIEQFAKKGLDFDYIVLMEPTSPLRKPGDIDGAIEKIVDTAEAESLVSVGEIHMEHPMIVKCIEEDGFVSPYIKDLKKIHQRQQADRAYFPYGVVYIVKKDVFIEKKTFYTEKTLPYPIERWQNYEIDDEIDFQITELLADKYLR